MAATETRICQNCNTAFTIDAADFDFYNKIKVPPPTWCPECRLRRRYLFRNERVLWRRKDDASGKDIIAGFPPDAPFPVYERDYWWSDAFSADQYGRDFDSSRPFLEQFRELMHAVPWPSRSVIGLVNSEYSDQAGWLRNCYLCHNADYLENCTYVIRAMNSKECCDALQIQQSELVYDSVLVDKCFRTFYSYDCESCSDTWFSKQCSGCTNVFGCVNLRNKSYYIWNEPYSKEDYFKKLEELKLDSRTSIQALKERALRFWLTAPSKYYHGIRALYSSGDMVRDAKNVRDSWWVSDAQDVRYSQCLYLKAADCYDYSIWGNNATRMYESVTCGEEVQDMKFCFECWPGCRNMEYCMGCHSSSDLFGCVGLKKKQYCILNKQYAKEEYEALREKIIAQMDDMPYGDKAGRVYKYGEFFPPEFSPFAYNETMLQDTFPLSKEQVLAAGYAWRDPEAKEYQTTLDAAQLPDRLADVTDDITKEIVQCAACRRAYRIIPAELAFYRRIGSPLPDRCPGCRHTLRFASLNPPSFRESACACAGAQDAAGTYRNTVVHPHGLEPCGGRFETAYPADYPGIVYCEQCYQTEVA